LHPKAEGNTQHIMSTKQAATEAFLRPRVDSSKARFTFARPDEELLADFCAAKMGWTQVRLLSISMSPMRLAPNCHPLHTSIRMRSAITHIFSRE
jgi:hypothetical protein